MARNKRSARGKPPVARSIGQAREHHAIATSDPYAWLRADNWRDVMRDPELLDRDIRDYLEAENAYARTALWGTGALRKTLFREMKARIKLDDSTVPARDGAFAYFTAYKTGGQHPLYCREKSTGGAREVLVDGNKLARGKAYFSLGGAEHSPDHKFLAYGTDLKGSEYYTVEIRNAATGKVLKDRIEDTTGHVEWSADGKSFFYTNLDDNHRPSRTFRHVLGTSSARDALVYEEPDQGFFTGIGKTQSGDYLNLATHDHQTSEVYLIDARNPGEKPKLVAGRKAGVEYEVEHHGNRLFILTNADKAEDFKIVEAPLSSPGRKNWRDVVGHKPGRLILHFMVFREFLVRLEREDGLPRIVVRALDTGKEHVIAFDEEAYSLGVVPGYEFDTRNLRFTYSSMTTPAQVYDYDMATRKRILRKVQEVPSGHRPEDYITRRVMAPAHDGESVPITLLYAKATPLDGTAPLLLYGYGAYGISIPASFSTNCLSLVDRGVIYAIAHIRGGKDKGYRWYAQGRGRHKTNTFEDFIDAARFLIDRGFTAKGRITAHGASAGGMLMGAVANMAPELFNAIIAEVPFVDVLNTMLDDSLPLTPPEWPEWGNPINDARAYRAIAAYAPYENVTAQDYPHILAVAGLTDPRVTYWEPAKWVARLRAVKTGDHLVLLKTNMAAGHGGAAGRFDRLHEVALNYAFALKMWGLADAG